jgi:hypothetical protein
MRFQTETQFLFSVLFRHVYVKRRNGDAEWRTGRSCGPSGGFRRGLVVVIALLMTAAFCGGCRAARRVAGAALIGLVLMDLALPGVLVAVVMLGRFVRSLRSRSAKGSGTGLGVDQPCSSGVWAAVGGRCGFVSPGVRFCRQ